MAATYKTEGIVLKRWDYREKDTMVRVLTRDFGKVTARAISSKKITSKLAGHLEPFIVADFFFAKSKTIDIVAGSNTIMRNERLRTSLTHMAAGQYIAEIVDRLVEDREVDSLLFEYVVGIFEMLSQQERVNTLSVYAAVVQIFEYLGYRFELSACHVCKREVGEFAGVVSEGAMKLHHDLRAIECGNCRSIEQVRELSADALRVMRFVQDQSFDDVLRLRVDDGVWQEIDFLVRSIISYQLGRVPVSEPVFLELLF